MKIKKRSKILAAAIALLGLSTAASVTGTVAWFTANNVVSVTGLNIQAEAEEGIVISNEAATKEWKTSTTASHQSATNNSKGFIPTSTADASSWWHANSDDVNKYEHAGDYAELTVTAPTAGEANSGVGTATVNGVTNRNIYLLNHFYVQSAINSRLTGQDLFIKEVKANDSAGKVLNKSLRVLFKLDSVSRIYCPLLGEDFTAPTGTHAGNAKAASTSTDTTVAEADKLLSNGIIPAYNAAGTGALDISVYLYFEGEDTNCKSANIDSLNSVSVEFKLENRPVSA